MNLLIFLGIIVLVVIFYVWPLIICWNNADKLIKDRVYYISGKAKNNEFLTKLEVDNIYNGWRWELLCGFIPIGNIYFALAGKIYLAL